ncbi:MAG: hypothetical protein NVS9B12_11740 [Vulcanimicrobiaceae bacterium]
MSGARLRCEREGESQTVLVAAVRFHQDRPLIRLEGVTDATQAGQFTGAKFYAPKEAFVLAEGEYLDEDLIGCVLLDAAGLTLGRVEAIEHYPGQDLLISGSARIPMVRAFIKNVNTARKEIAVDLPLGLLDSREADEA